MAGRIRIGVSGWRYPPWRGNFYPPGPAQRRELEHAARQFPSIELNGSFYLLQRPSSYAAWAEQTPAGFVFAIKGGRYITHMQDRNRRMRHAVEVRHHSFATPEFIALLRKYRITWVVADTPEPWPLYEDVTADFVYLRLHGSTELYKSRYTRAQLERWADCIRAWSQGRQPADARLISPEPPPQRTARDVYCYFDNTDKLHAPDNARELMDILGLLPLQPGPGPLEHCP